ncbi:MAG: peptidylprolyl isomerase [Planctomycetes bacterium]|nr:peptidylprolyl isomerase [Planctomycetota bacterium]
MKKWFANCSVALLALCVCAALLFQACGNDFNHPPPPNSLSGNTGPVSPEVQAFRDDAVSLQLRPELDIDKVTIQFVLIAEGLEGDTDEQKKLTLGEAEELCAKVYQKAKAGEDFDKLVLTYSYDSVIHGQRPSMVTLLRGLAPDAELSYGPNTFRREQEEVGITIAAWRLQPGEIGVVERNESDASNGYYVVRRLTDEEVKQDNPANFPPANDAVATLRADAAELMKRPEHDAKRVKVQHILIGRYFSDPEGKHKRLSPEEAEALAAEVYAKAKEGESFNKLVREYTYDSTKGDPPGSYIMVADKDAANKLQTWREGMVPAFGDVAWRLEIGEVGVAMYDRARSWYGYHIVKRIE